MLILSAVVALVVAAAAAIAHQCVFGIRRLVLARTILLGLLSAGFLFVAHLLTTGRGDDVDGWASLAEVAVPLTFALFATRAATVRRRFRTQVALAIPSRKEFHEDVRYGLRAELDPRITDLRDPYYELSSGAAEDLSTFTAVLRACLRERPDVIVTCVPFGQQFVDVRSEIGQWCQRGGLLVFIESGIYLDEVTDELPRVAAIEVGGSGMQELAEWVKANHSPSEQLPALVVAGPKDSRPAQERVRILEEVLGAESIEVWWTPRGWSPREAKAIVETAWSEDRHRVVVCGNDGLAIGATKALAALGVTGAGVTGFDGLPRVLASIADPHSLIQATVRIPPSHYGRRAVRHILASRSLGMLWSSTYQVQDRIEIGGANLITKENVTDMLPPP